MTDGVAGFGERVLSARLRAGSDRRRRYTQAELADAVGVEQASVSRWEGGSLPDAETIEKIADALGVRAGWLLFGEEPMHAPPSGKNGLHIEHGGSKPAPIVAQPDPRKTAAKKGKARGA